MSRVFIGLGSNEGDRLAELSRAIEALAQTPGIRVAQLAPIYETEPIGGPPQSEFLNTVVELETELPPHELLAALKAIECRAGRRPSGERWGPRVLDLDILLYDDRILNSEALTIPHLRMHQRWFVLEPLAQLAPELRHPVLRQTIAELLEQLPRPAEDPVASALL